MKIVVVIICLFGLASSWDSDVGKPDNYSTPNFTLTLPKLTSPNLT
jgi:hypothetical protein